MGFNKLKIQFLKIEEKTRPLKAPGFQKLVYYKLSGYIKKRKTILLIQTIHFVRFILRTKSRFDLLPRTINVGAIQSHLKFVFFCFFFIHVKFEAQILYDTAKYVKVF